MRNYQWGFLAYLVIYRQSILMWSHYFRAQNVWAMIHSVINITKRPPRKGYNHPRRWVKYKDTPEASAVPAEWHGWLHHQTDIFPEKGEKSFRRKWQKPHKANMTGTHQSYRPKGHVLAGGQRDKATGDYEAWDPNEKIKGNKK